MKNIFKWLFSKKVQQTTTIKQEVNKPILKVIDEYGNDEDELTTAVINECFRTGKIVFAKRDNNGNIIFK